MKAQEVAVCQAVVTLAERYFLCVILFLGTALGLSENQTVKIYHRLNSVGQREGRMGLAFGDEL